MSRPRKPAPELPSDMLALTRDLTEPAIPDAELSALASLADAPAEQFQAAAGALFRRLAIEGFRTIQAPRNIKELNTVVSLWRKLEGLENKGSGDSIPAGLVGVMRPITRRVVDAVPVDTEPDMPPAFE